jgi:hypothetical protein
MTSREWLSTQRERIDSATHIESNWWRAAIGGSAAVVATVLAEAVTESFPIRLLIIFFGTLTVALLLALSIKSVTSQ